MNVEPPGESPLQFGRQFAGASLGAVDNRNAGRAGRGQFDGHGPGQTAGPQKHHPFSGGVEQEVFRVFKARVGLKKQAYFDTPWLITGGFGLDINTESIAGKYIIVDGAYEYNTIDVFPVANVSFRIGF